MKQQARDILNPGICKIEERFEADVQNFQLKKPEEGRLVRNWEPGLNLQYRTSKTLMSLKCLVYSIQIDNQLPDAYFPITFYKQPVKPTNLRNEKNDFLDFGLFTEQQDVLQIYRYRQLINLLITHKSI